ncbi:ThiF family adenylyltransferase [Bacillus sp. NEAU-Y102]
MNRVTVVVGAGGTGSYVMPNLTNLYHTDTNDNCIVLIDGDVVEEKNLLRQGFLRKDLNGNKAEVLAKRYGVAYPDLGIYYSTGFVNDVSAVLGVVDTFSEVDEVVLVSCVDNNYARLRLLLAQFQIFDKYGCDVHFIDAGNEEWHGQVIPCSLYSGNENPLKLQGNRVTFHAGACGGHALDSIFVGIENWRTKLTRGDHELSCDEVTVSHPQNIGTNMMSAATVVKAVQQVTQKVKVAEIRFNSRSNKFSVGTGSTSEQLVERLEDICRFVNEEDTNIFGDSRIPVIPANRSMADKFKKATKAKRVAVPKKKESKDLVDILSIFDDDDFGIDIDDVAEPEVASVKKEEGYESWLSEFLDD